MTATLCSEAYPVASQNRTSLRISELYLSIQGEGQYSGRPCFFIRLAGCDLRCRWCDSPSALQASNGKLLAIGHLLDQIPQGIPLIQLTGGEPLLQKQGLLELCYALREARPQSTILLETGGHIDLDQIPDFVHICMDIKLASSGEDSSRHKQFGHNLALLKSTDEIKFVIADQTDFLQAREWIREHNLATVCSILMSPVWDTLALTDLAQWILHDQLPVRLQLQLHKIIWGNREGI